MTGCINLTNTVISAHHRPGTHESAGACQMTQAQPTSLGMTAQSPSSAVSHDTSPPPAAER